MRHFRTHAGPFAERPYYEDRDVENICVDALREVGLLPSEPRPIRIDRFIEKRFGVVPSYEDLPQGVLGLTRFTTQGVQEVVVARLLDMESSRGAERRIRTTLAHEAGHCLLHEHLFVLSAVTKRLFGDDTETDSPKILCRDAPVPMSSRRYSGHWWEFQANMAIPHLLMPRVLVEQAVHEFLVPSGDLGGVSVDPARYDSAIQDLTETFDVNGIVARFRINNLYHRAEDGQMVL